MAKEKEETAKDKPEEKEKICFVIMPISDALGYEDGHFKRVYEFIIKPACYKAGFTPIRADDIKTTNHIIIDILKRLIEADMAICDLSAKNPNVLYELGIRQAFNLPVTLLKDEKTDRIFDIQTLRDVYYHSSLRVDTIEEIVTNLADAITDTFKNKDKSINSIIQLLEVEAATVKKTEISEDTILILNAIKGISNTVNLLEETTSQLSMVPDSNRRINTLEIPIISGNVEADDTKIHLIVKQFLNRFVVRSKRTTLGFIAYIESEEFLSKERLATLIQKLNEAGFAGTFKYYLH